MMIISDISNSVKSRENFEDYIYELCGGEEYLYSGIYVDFIGGIFRIRGNEAGSEEDVGKNKEDDTVYYCTIEHLRRYVLQMGEVMEAHIENGVDKYGSKDEEYNEEQLKKIKRGIYEAVIEAY